MTFSIGRLPSREDLRSLLGPAVRRRLISSALGRTESTMDREPQNGPLSSVEMEEEGWNERQTLIDSSEDPKHTLPESERDSADMWDESDDDLDNSEAMLPPD